LRRFTPLFQHHALVQAFLGFVDSPCFKAEGSTRQATTVGIAGFQFLTKRAEHTGVVDAVVFGRDDDLLALFIIKHDISFQEKRLRWDSNASASSCVSTVQMISSSGV